jgi:hypothetical protein
MLSGIRGCTPKQRISIYADDVALFIKPNVQDIVTVRQVLNMFGMSSGLQVNFSKSSAVVIRG